MRLSKPCNIDFHELGAEIAELREDHNAAAEEFRFALTLRRDRLPGEFAPEHFFMESVFNRSTNTDGQIQFEPFCEYVETDLKLAKVLHRSDRPYATARQLGKTAS